MAYVTADRVKETSTTTGTSNFSLAGAVTGYRAFSAVCSNNDVCWYCITLQSGTEWEIGLGTWVTGNTLNRTAANVLAGTAGAATLVTFSAGTKDVFITAPASKAFILQDENAAVIPKVTTVPPAAAATDTLKLYARNRAGRMLPEFIGPSGLDSAVQPALFGNAVRMWLPGTGTTVAIAFGVSWTTSATQAHPAITNTSFMTQMLRATFTTTTTAGNQAGVRSAAPVCWRGNAAGLGGFFFFARFGILTYHSAMQIFIGLAAASGAMAGDPSAINDSVYCGKDTGETVWQVATRDTSSASKTGSGRTTAAAGATDIFDFTAFCKPNDSKITVRMVDMTTGTVLVDNVEKSSNLPTAGTMLYAHAETRNVTGGAGVTAAIFLTRIYIESDT
jgi:hypothetical protein